MHVSRDIKLDGMNPDATCLDLLILIADMFNSEWAFIQVS